MEENAVLTHGSLFSGIGGFDLAAESVGFENIFSCEKDEFCDKLLKQNFPNVKRFKDIYEFNAREYNGRIDIVSGGFPCQPFSVAGKRQGENDDRHLWPQMLRVIAEIKPRWVIAENVPGLLTISGGMVFEQCCLDLEAEGYEVQAFVIPAISKNAPHRRDRLWIIANSPSFGYGRRRIHGNGKDRERAICPNVENNRDKVWGEISSCGNPSEHVANSFRSGLERRMQPNKFAEYNRRQSQRWEQNWYEVATQFCRVDDGLPNRVDRIKALGNAIVPQVAIEIFKAIKYAENHEFTTRN